MVKKIKPIALGVVKLPCLKASVSQFEIPLSINFLKNSIAKQDCSKNFFGLDYTSQILPIML